MTGAIELPAGPPPDANAAASKGVRRQPDGDRVGVAVYIGAMDGSTGNCVFTPLSGIPPGGLPGANTVSTGAHLIVAIPGTPPTGPMAGVLLLAGDWVISDGANWNALHLGSAATVASSVAVTPTVFGTNNVQTELAAAQAQINARLPLAGGTMTGQIVSTVAGSPTANTHIVNRGYVDQQDNLRLALTGGNISGIINMNNGAGLYLKSASNANGATTGNLAGYDAGNNLIGVMNFVRRGFNVRPEAEIHLWQQNGGYSSMDVFYTQTNSPPSVYFLGNISCNALTQRSDLSMKQNVALASVDEACAAFDLLKPIRYRWIDCEDPNQPLHWGLSADDVEAGAPEAVVLAGEVPVKHYDVAAVLAIAIAKIKQLETEVTDLRRRVTH